MNDILVDQAGDFRCPNCHGRNFDRKRTLKGKVGLGVVVLPAAALAPKRMKCLQCGTYSKTGNAQRWADPSSATRVARPPRNKQAAIALTPHPNGVVIELVGANTVVSAVVAAKLVQVMPTASLGQREAIAARVIAGERTRIAQINPSEVPRALELLGRIGLMAEASDPPPTVQP